MMRSWIRFGLAAALALGAAACSDDDEDGPGRLAPAGSLVVLTDTNELFWVQPTDPDDVIDQVAVTGLAAGEDLVGIDFRPATGDLYALSDEGRLYRIDALARAIRVVPDSLAIEGSQFGVDFSPIADRLRIVNEIEDNWRMHPGTGTIVQDTNLSPAMTVAAIAYTDEGTTTTLYGLDALSDVLVRIGGAGGVPSPNGGAVTTLGPLGVDAEADPAFDISPSGTAYAALRVGLTTHLYTIDLVSGAATLVGTLGTGGDADGLSMAL
jgi:hypothetical protein